MNRISSALFPAVLVCDPYLIIVFSCRPWRQALVFTRACLPYSCPVLDSRVGLFPQAHLTVLSCPLTVATCTPPQQASGRAQTALKEKLRSRVSKVDYRARQQHGTAEAQFSTVSI